MVTSGVIHTTFIVHTVCAMPELYSWFAGISTPTAPHLMTSVVWFIGVLAETMLLAFADRQDPEERAKSPESNPELHCSFLNRLLLWWFNPLPRLGAHKSLEIDDLFELNHRGSSDYLVPLWERYWTPTIKGSWEFTQIDLIV
jgi:hypothetical protein